MLRFIGGFAVGKSPNPQRPVEAYFFESLTMTCIFTGDPLS